MSKTKKLIVPDQGSSNRFTREEQIRNYIAITTWTDTYAKHGPSRDIFIIGIPVRTKKKTVMQSEVTRSYGTFEQ